MVKMYYLLVLFISFLSCNTEVPTQFSEDALNDTFLTLNGGSVAFRDILNAHKGELLVIDVWASWCGDCIKGMLDVKALQSEYKEVTYLFLSLDKTPKTWKDGIKKYNVKGEHYYMKSGWKGPFGEFVDLDWIPRYMIIGKTGKIELFKAVKADDERIKKILN